MKVTNPHSTRRVMGSAPCASKRGVKRLQVTECEQMIRRSHPRFRWSLIKSVLVGFLAMVLSLIALWVILGAIVLRTKREIPIGPVYFLIPIVTFTAGCYWSMRRSARPKGLAKPPSNVTIILKSTAVGITAMVLSVIGYLIWLRLRIPRDTISFVSVDISALFYWPVLLVSFLGGFLLEYRIASRQRFRLTGGTFH